MYLQFFYCSVGDIELLVMSRKNKVEEMQTDPKNSRLPIWLGCLNYHQAAGYPETDFFILYCKNSPNLPCYITSRVHNIESQSVVPPLRSSVIKLLLQKRSFSVYYNVHAWMAFIVWHFGNNFCINPITDFELLSLYYDKEQLPCKSFYSDLNRAVSIKTEVPFNPSSGCEDFRYNPFDIVFNKAYKTYKTQKTNKTNKTYKNYKTYKNNKTFKT